MSRQPGTKVSAHPWSLQQPLMIVSLLIINRCPSIDEWQKKMWYIHMKSYSAVKSSEIMFVQGNGWNWRSFDLKYARLRKKNVIFSHMQNLDEKRNETGLWWCTPLILELRRSKQLDL